MVMGRDSVRPMVEDANRQQHAVGPLVPVSDYPVARSTAAAATDVMQNPWNLLPREKPSDLQVSRNCLKIRQLN